MRWVSFRAMLTRYDVVGYDADPASPTFDTFRLKNPLGFDDPVPLT